MRLRHIKGAEEAIAASEFVINNPQEYKGNWRGFFGNIGNCTDGATGERYLENNLILEIGMGKGRFIMENALKYPQNNYIGIEMYSSVLLRALEKMKEMELANLRFLRFDATYIEDIFDESEVDKIYLNFSDPWPKDRHAKRRLPGTVFLQRFSKILKPGGIIEFKTDNRELFDFGLESIYDSDFELLEKTYDLHNNPDMISGNVLTEYEERFSALGNPICKYIIVNNKEKT